MEIYLINPDHGKKISHFQAEADADKRNGWKEVSKEEYYKPKEDRKKPGPKPKNTLNADSNPAN